MAPSVIFLNFVRMLRGVGPHRAAILAKRSAEVVEYSCSTLYPDLERIAGCTTWYFCYLMPLDGLDGLVVARSSCRLDIVSVYYGYLPSQGRACNFKIRALKRVNIMLHTRRHIEDTQSLL